MEHWGWLIIIYLFLGGLGAGAYVAAFAAERGWLGNVPRLDQVGFFISGPLVGIGCLLLVFDLEQGFHKPWLILNMILNPQSVMAWGVWILTLFIFLALAKTYYSWTEKTTPLLLDYAGLAAALSTGFYTGLLLMVVKAMPLWNSTLLPVLFVISAMSTGLSAATLLAKECTAIEEEGNVPKVHTWLIFAEIIVVAFFFSSVLTGAQGPAAVISAQTMLSGSMSIIFWLIFIGVGLIAPLTIFALKTFLHKTFPAQVVGLSKTGVLIGGFALRYLIVYAAIPVWNGMIN
jgi:polysulfide reductase chain C